MAALASVTRRELDPSVNQDTLTGTVTTSGDTYTSLLGTVLGYWVVGRGAAVTVTSISGNVITITVPSGTVVDIFCWGIA